jgi:hypothetical protein
MIYVDGSYGCLTCAGPTIASDLRRAARASARLRPKLFAAAKVRTGQLAAQRSSGRACSGCGCAAPLVLSKRSAHAQHGGHRLGSAGPRRKQRRSARSRAGPRSSFPLRPWLTRQRYFASTGCATSRRRGARIGWRTPTSRRSSAGRETSRGCRGCEKRHFLRHLYVKAIFLPRRVRDKHRESTQKRVAFFAG